MTDLNTPGPIIVAAGKKGISPRDNKNAGRSYFLPAFVDGQLKGVAPGRVFKPPLCLREDSAISIALMFQNLQRGSWRGRLSSPASPWAWELPHSGLSSSCGGDPCSLGALGPLARG